MDGLRDKCHFIDNPLYILSRCAEVDEVEGGIAEMSKIYNETWRELYIGAGDRERD